MSVVEIAKSGLSERRNATLNMDVSTTVAQSCSAGVSARRRELRMEETLTETLKSTCWLRS
jgi:hypothetical protein